MNNCNGAPPVSPVSTSPYIPIFECITGKSPIIDPNVGYFVIVSFVSLFTGFSLQDIKSLLGYNNKISNSNVDHVQNYTMLTNNEAYELTQRHLNYMNLPNDPRFYDCPRKLTPHQQVGQKCDQINANDNKNHSPLQSPTDSDSVFNDEQWVNNNTSSDLSK